MSSKKGPVKLKARSAVPVPKRTVTAGCTTKMHEGTNSSAHFVCIISTASLSTLRGAVVMKLKSGVNDIPYLAAVLSTSIYKDREKEMLYEEERQKWILSYEEKSSMIEQLERELTSTVDALNQEKREKTDAQNELIESSRRGPSSSYRRRSNDLREGKNLADYNTLASPQILSDRNCPDSAHCSENDNPNHRILELLRQSQEETALVRRDLSILRKQSDLMSDQVLDQKRQINRLINEKMQIAKSLENSDGRVLFRDQQVISAFSPVIQWSYHNLKFRG